MEAIKKKLNALKSQLSDAEDRALKAENEKKESDIKYEEVMNHSKTVTRSTSSLDASLI